MPTQTTVDFPDFSRRLETAQELINNEFFTVINGPVVRGPFLVGGIPYLGLEFSANVNGFDVQFKWFLDEATNIQIGATTVQVAAGCFMDQTIKFRGTFVTVTVTPTGAGSQFTMQLFDLPGGDGIFLENLAIGQLLSINGVVLAALATTTVTATQVFTGPAHLDAFSPDGNFLCLLQTVDLAGAATNRGGCGGPDAHYDTWLPGIRTRFLLQNVGAAAATFYAFLTAKPYV
jgi:hypothetical protein